MGILESKELDKNDPRFAYDQNDPANQQKNNPVTSNVNQGDNNNIKPSRNNKFEEEDKFAENTQSSINDNDVINSIRNSNRNTPYRNTSKRKEVFTAMTSRVLNNKENRKGLANSSSRYDKKQKNIDNDGIEWVKKEEIIETNLVSSKPYGTKFPKAKMFGPGSGKKSRFIKAKSGVMTYLPPQALAVILSYDMNGFRKYMSV